MGSGKGKLDDLNISVLMCQEFGWTYDQYRSQPAWWLHLAQQMISLKNEAINKQSKNGI